ncbi:MAG: hypothetical protein SPL28_01295 [Bacteroidales bacterium]|nr:hypothetical protein [Bacteroidales bacterium]
MNTNDFELEEMRQQMAILQNKLSNQNIVNDRFIRRAIKHGMSTINKRYLVISIIALAMIPYGYWAFVVINGLSISLWLALSMMMLMVVAFCFFNGRAMRNSQLADGNLRETMRQVAAAKRRDNNWQWIGIPMALAWSIWVGWEMAQKIGADIKFFMPFFIICIVAGIIAGLTVHFRTQRHYRDIIEQIEDFEDETAGA